MITTKKVTGLALAATAAALFATAPMTTSAGASSIGHCMGVNACKGHSDCKTAKNACKGQNACKVQGFVEMTKQTCMQIGGDFVMIGFLKEGSAEVPDKLQYAAPSPARALHYQACERSLKRSAGLLPNIV
jgi:hypothetical protein